MPEVKWIKITTDMFDDEKIRIIESMPDADAILTIWIKLLCQAGKCNEDGYIKLFRECNVTAEDLATLFNRPLNTVKLALSLFEKYGMIEFTDDGHLYLPNWEKHQNIIGLENIRNQTRIRVQRHRDKQKLLVSGVTETLRNVTVTHQKKKKKEDIDNKHEHDARAHEDKNIFELYEENIGQLTPIVADQLKAYSKDYTEKWLLDAIKETAENNAHSIKYVKAILERWQKDGYQSRNNGNGDMRHVSRKPGYLEGRDMSALNQANGGEDAK